MKLKTIFKSEVPKYYDQVQMLMGMLGFKSCLVFILNKNTCELRAIHLCYDEFRYYALKLKAEDIIANVNIMKVNDGVKKYPCMMCEYKVFCHENKKCDTEQHLQCSTCHYVMTNKYSTITKTGWYCGNKKSPRKYSDVTPNGLLW